MDPHQMLVAVSGLVQGLTDSKIRSSMLEAIRRDQARNWNALQLNGSFGIEFLNVLAEVKSVSPLDQVCKEVFYESGGHERLVPLLDALWWGVRTGLLVPGEIGGRGTATFGGVFLATSLCRRVLENPDDVPFAPDFVRRAKERCPGLADTVVVHLEDSHACHEIGLERPAVVMLGLAYEAAIEAVLDALAKLGHQFKMPREAKDRIDLLRKLLPKVVPDDERRRKAEEAIAYAEQLRSRRNQASHTEAHWPFTDHEEVDELLLSGGRHLPEMWGFFC